MISLFFVVIFSVAQDPQIYQNATTPLHTIDSLKVSFPSSLAAARERLLVLKSQIANSELTSTALPTKNAPPLYIQFLFLPKKSNKLFILSSGTHGAEAFAGMALQDLFLQDYIRSPEKYPFNVLLLHTQNPYGAINFRRTNANNVDLNRNYVLETEQRQKNLEFEKLQATYLPSTPASADWLRRGWFYFKMSWYSFVHGRKSILTTLSGQYSYPQNLYYGGQELEPEALAVQAELLKRMTPMQKVLHIDLHTGYGKKGHLHYFSSHEFNSPEQMQLLQKIFKDKELNSGSQEDFYKTYGDFNNWTWKIYPQKTVIPMVFEFGTKDSQKLLGGLASLWASVAENQGFFNGYKTRKDQDIIHKEFESLFNPQDEDWQREVLQQGWRGISESLQNFQQL